MGAEEESADTEEAVCPLCRLCEELRKSEACQHLMNAQKELLLAVRACIDDTLDRLERKQEAGKVEEIPVE